MGSRFRHVLFGVALAVALTSCNNLLGGSDGSEDTSEEEQSPTGELSDLMVEVIPEGSMGTFVMGSAGGSGDERPAHRVTLTRPYSITQQEITNNQYVAVMNEALSEGWVTTDGSTLENAQGAGRELADLDDSDSRLELENDALSVTDGYGNHPVTEVTWFGAVAYAYYLNKIEGAAQAYDLSSWEADLSATGYRLPTEAEWEYAARGGADGGDHLYAGSDDVSAVAWYEGNAAGSTNAVGLKEPNALGLYDMSGNVREWVQDWKSNDYYEVSPIFDPAGPQTGTERVKRGGDFSDDAYQQRVTDRWQQAPSDSWSQIGFRVVKVTSGARQRPAAVSNLTGIPGSGQVTLQWSDPADLTVSAIDIWWSPAGQRARVVEPGVQRYVADGLTNDTEYRFTVATRDEAGNISTLERVAVTPTSGTVYERSFDDGQLYYVYVSPAAERDPSGARLLVSVHGYGGRTLDADGRDRVKRAATRWAELVDDNGWIALAPQFDQDRFDNDYQRLNFGGDLRADDRLHALIERVGEAYPGLATDTFYLWGFSGGGQFAHRYTLFHPTRVERAVVGAPGWYVFPDTDLPYAVGLDPETLPADRSPKWSEFSKVPILVTVGAEDGGGGAFRESYYYDGTNYNLKDLQGEGRAARARNWVDAVNTELTERSLPQNVTLEVIPGLGHSINADMRDGVESFFRAE